MHQVPRLWVPIVRGIFTHRRNANAILELDTAQLEWTEQAHRISS
jgi:hypothetical protein